MEDATAEDCVCIEELARLIKVVLVVYRGLQYLRKLSLERGTTSTSISTDLLVPLRDMFVEALESINLCSDNLLILVVAVECLENLPTWVLLVPLASVAIKRLQQLLACCMVLGTINRAYFIVGYWYQDWTCVLVDAGRSQTDKDRKRAYLPQGQPEAARY